jgi:ferric-dicitrate binding protein FerR (iron transport regulator)
MRTSEQNLRLQACIDDELSARERRQVESWLARDAGAHASAAELRAVARCLAANETPRPVPESRDFYWSKIARAIESETAAHEAARPQAAWERWRRWWLPAAAAVSLLALGGFGLLRWSSNGQNPAVLAVVNDLETPIQEASSFSFRAEAERMTVVWVNFQYD